MTADSGKADAVRPDLKQLPRWADEWANGVRCECGARAVYCYGWGGRHTVCSRSSWGVDKCPEAGPG